VDFADRDWRARFLAAKSGADLHIAPRELGPTPEGEDPYERGPRCGVRSRNATPRAVSARKAECRRCGNIRVRPAYRCGR
jgi:hypothetical protein